MSVKRSIICLKVLSVLVFMQFFQVSYAQYDFASLDRFVEKSKDVLGKDYAIVISKEGKNIYTKNSNDEFSVTTQVKIANASKWLSCAMIMTLVDQGTINLDDKISKYIPLTNKYLKGYITIRHCLTNQTGLEQVQYKISGNKNFASLEEEVNDIITKNEIMYPTGEYFTYGSAGLSIAARICEIVTKKQFVTLMNDRIFKPLQIRSTNFGDGDKSPNPSAGVISTVQDYTTFLKMLLNNGKHKEKIVMSKNAIEQMHKLQVDEDKIKFLPDEVQGVGKKYGYGAWLIETNDKGEATALASPGFFGNWPFIDLCRGYTCVVFVKNLGNEKRKNYLTQLKAIVDEIIPTTCN